MLPIVVFSNNLHLLWLLKCQIAEADGESNPPTDFSPAHWF